MGRGHFAYAWDVATLLTHGTWPLCLRIRPMRVCTHAYQSFKSLPTVSCPEFEIQPNLRDSRISMSLHHRVCSHVRPCLCSMFSLSSMRAGLCSVLASPEEGTWPDTYGFGLSTASQATLWQLYEALMDGAVVKPTKHSNRSRSFHGTPIPAN
jgi:hypothetical protein